MIVGMAMIIMAPKMGVNDGCDGHHGDHAKLDMYGFKPYISHTGEMREKVKPMFAMVEPADAVEMGARMEKRKEVRLHATDLRRIKAAAAAVGLSESDFMRHAALQQVGEIERSSAKSVLPHEIFAAFSAAVSAPGKVIPGLAQAAKLSEGRLKDG